MAKSKDTKKKKDDVSVTIEEEYGMIGDDKLYARIAWNDKPAKDEVRKVWVDKEGERHLGKGIDLDEDEVEELYKLKKKAHPDGVDFDAIFKSTRGISERRAAGMVTKDGFIVLQRKGG